MSTVTSLRVCKKCGDELGLGAFDAAEEICRACLRPRDQRAPAEECKECTACGEFKPVLAFRPDNRRGRRYQSWCRGCERDYAADYDIGIRRRDAAAPVPRRVNRNRQGIFVCLCPVARLRPDNKTCRCGMPVVARMHPDLQARMAQKYPPIVDQRVVEVVA